MNKVWQCFEDFYNQFPSLAFGTPLTLDKCCCICGRFLIFGYEDPDRNHKCIFCYKCLETVKNCPIAEHGRRLLSKEMMTKRLINPNPIDVLIICPHNCGNLYTAMKLWDHLFICRNRPKESIPEKHIDEDVLQAGNSEKTGLMQVVSREREL